MMRVLAQMKFCRWAVAVCVAAAFAATTAAKAQTRTGATMGFLDIPQATRLVGTGGMHVASGTGGSSLVFHNPSAVADSAGGDISLNITPVTDGIKYVSASYSHNADGVGTFSAGLTYAGYGDFVRTDDTGAELGLFSANEGALYIGYARPLAPWLRLGASFKPIFSKLADYTSFALAMDMGATFLFAQGRLNTSVVVRNAGGIVKRYSADSSAKPLPLDVKIGLCYKPEHAPFRLFLTLKDLTQWDLSPRRDKSLDAGDNILRHTLVGLEFVPVRAFYASVGYDHRRRREMADAEAGAMAGLSWGLGLHVAKIDIQYAHSRYHAAGSLNSITMATNWKRWVGR